MDKVGCIFHAKLQCNCFLNSCSVCSRIFRAEDFEPGLNSTPIGTDTQKFKTCTMRWWQVKNFKLKESALRTKKRRKWKGFIFSFATMKPVEGVAFAGDLSLSRKPYECEAGRESFVITYSLLTWLYIFPTRTHLLLLWWIQLMTLALNSVSRF